MKISSFVFAQVCAWLLLLVPSLHAQSARLINISTRGQVGTGANILIGGFSISGGEKTVLIRAVGPGLDAFNVSGTVADPVLNIFNSSGTIVATNDNWQSADAATFARVGAFAPTPGTKDAVIVKTLPPGGYSAQISGLGPNPTGGAVGSLRCHRGWPAREHFHPSSGQLRRQRGFCRFRRRPWQRHAQAPHPWRGSGARCLRRHGHAA